MLAHWGARRVDSNIEIRFCTRPRPHPRTPMCTSLLYMYVRMYGRAVELCVPPAFGRALMAGGLHSTRSTMVLGAAGYGHGLRIRYTLRIGKSGHQPLPLRSTCPPSWAHDQALGRADPKLCARKIPKSPPLQLRACAAADAIEPECVSERTRSSQKGTGGDGRKEGGFFVFEYHEFDAMLIVHWRHLVSSSGSNANAKH